jgi:hypothetical protein
MGAIKEGCGGLTEQIPFQGLDPECTFKYYYALRVAGADICYSNHAQGQAARCVSYLSSFTRVRAVVEEVNLYCMYHFI